MSDEATALWRFGDGKSFERALDALPSSTSNQVYRLDEAGLVLWTADATAVLRAFSRRCALDVAHLWDASEIVRRYLGTGDEAIREEARAAAAAAYSHARATYATCAATAITAAYAAVAYATAYDAAYDAACAAANAARSAAAYVKYAGCLEEMLMTLAGGQ